MKMLRSYKKGFFMTVMLSMPILFFGMIALIPKIALADSLSDAKQLVDKANMTWQNYETAKEMDAFRDLVKKAEGVYVAPGVLEGAFIFGVSGGSGVFLAKDQETGKWSDPAFYTMGEVSFGLQAGGKASDIVLLAMTDRGVNAFLGDSFKLGGDLSVAAGPVGAGAAAATENLSADIIGFSRSEGAYAGISLEGAVMKVRNDWNKAYYGKEVSPKDILILQDVHNPQAADLANNVAAEAAGK